MSHHTYVECVTAPTMSGSGLSMATRDRIYLARSGLAGPGRLFSPDLADLAEIGPGWMFLVCFGCSLTLYAAIPSSHPTPSHIYKQMCYAIVWPFGWHSNFSPFHVTRGFAIVAERTVA